MIKVALVKPPQAGSLVRGGGYYANRLLQALEKFVDVTASDFSLLPGAYSRFDIVHFPFFDEHFFTLPPILPPKLVVSILDCTKLKFPKHFPRGLRAKVAWPWQKALVSNASAVITISQSAKKDITSFFGLDPDKVFVTYLAADKQFQPVEDKKKLEAVVKKYHLPKKFALYVGGVNWNKNIPTLIKACQKIRFPLVLIGKEFTASGVDLSHIENQPLKEIRRLAEGDRLVHLLGFVPTTDLVAIYNLAAVYVQPSIYEGFGLPVLEAMTCGTAVVCGQNGSLPEIAGRAATYADVESLDDLASKIESAKPTGKEIAQAKKFSWEKTARETYEVYKQSLAA